jgi:hypothetical protein
MKSGRLSSYTANVSDIVLFLTLEPQEFLIRYVGFLIRYNLWGFVYASSIKFVMLSKLIKRLLDRFINTNLTTCRFVNADLLISILCYHGNYVSRVGAINAEGYEST